MGPARYDFSGTMVFLKHRSYGAKVAFLDTPYTHSLTASAQDDITGAQPLQSRWKKPRKIICRTNCFVCKEASTSGQNPEDVADNSRTICENQKWVWHLTQFTKKGSDPLSFKFVEHHKTQAFTFISSHDESVWNLDGEMFQACEVSVQACRGLVNFFASGPEL
ncbi:Diacylglycerol kinase [Zea mays]|nr:Diacylglycerol kinase [Zea mays]